jgi:hypothetical protein
MVLDKVTETYALHHAADHDVNRTVHLTSRSSLRVKQPSWRLIPAKAGIQDLG